MSTKENFVKVSKQQVCKLTLREMSCIGKQLNFILDTSSILPDTYKDIVLMSPSKESNLGIKISSKLEKHIDEVVTYIMNGLDIQNCYFFSAYESKSNKTNLALKIKTDSKNFICLYCPDAFLESLYSSIRNALAHGNIIQKGNHYYLFAVSSKEKCDILDKNITFFLKINKLEKIQTYMDAFKKFN